MNNSLSPKKIENIILADDDDDDQKFFRDALTETGLDINLHVINNGIDLIVHLQKDDGLIPQIIFLDINMPQKNGIQCLEEIRKNEKLIKTPVIIYSTSSYKPNIEETFRKGANLYFIKPSSYLKLVDSLKTILGLDWNKFISNSDIGRFIFNLNQGY